MVEGAYVTLSCDRQRVKLKTRATTDRPYFLVALKQKRLLNKIFLATAFCFVNFSVYIYFARTTFLCVSPHARILYYSVCKTV